MGPAMKRREKAAETNVVEVGFLRSELQVGLTLTRIAMDARHHDKSKRNCINARKAYDSVLRFLPNVSLSADESKEIASKLKQLRAELEVLGEKV